jgi:hypothetical protein
MYTGKNRESAPFSNRQYGVLPLNGIIIPKINGSSVIGLPNEKTG